MLWWMSDNLKVEILKLILFVIFWQNLKGCNFRYSMCEIPSFGALRKVGSLSFLFGYEQNPKILEV